MEEKRIDEEMKKFNEVEQKKIHSNHLEKSKAERELKDFFKRKIEEKNLMKNKITKEKLNSERRELYKHMEIEKCQ